MAKLSEQQLPAIAYYVGFIKEPWFAKENGKYVLRNHEKIWSDADLMEVYHSEYEQFQKYIQDNPNWKIAYASIYKHVTGEELEIDFGVQLMKFDKEIIISWLIQTKSDRFMWQDLPNQDKLGLFDITTGKFVTNELLESYWRTWGNLIEKWQNSQNVVTKPKEKEKEKEKEWVPYKVGKHDNVPLSNLRMTEVKIGDFVSGQIVSFFANYNKAHWFIIEKPMYTIKGSYKLFRKILPKGDSSFLMPTTANITNLYKVEVYE